MAGTAGVVAVAGTGAWISTLGPVKRKLRGLWLKKINRMSAKRNIPMISAATPMLLMMATSRTPATLMTVPIIIETRAMKTGVGIQGNRMVAGILGKIVCNGIGMVNATPVIVRTPAKK